MRPARVPLANRRLILVLVCQVVAMGFVVLVAGAAVKPGVVAAAPPPVWYAETETSLLGPGGGLADSNARLETGRLWVSGSRLRAETDLSDGKKAVMVVRGDLGVTWEWVEPCDPGTGEYVEEPLGPIGRPEFGPAVLSAGLQMPEELVRLNYEALGTQSLFGEPCAKQVFVVEFKTNETVELEEMLGTDVPAPTMRLTCTTWVSQARELPLQTTIEVGLCGLPQWLESELTEQGLPWTSEAPGSETGSFTMMTVVIRYSNFATRPIPETMFDLPPGYVRQTGPPAWPEAPETPLEPLPPL